MFAFEPTLCKYLIKSGFFLKRLNTTSIKAAIC